MFMGQLCSASVMKLAFEVDRSAWQLSIAVCAYIRRNQDDCERHRDCQVGVGSLGGEFVPVGKRRYTHDDGHRERYQTVPREEASIDNCGGDRESISNSRRAEIDGVERAVGACIRGGGRRGHGVRVQDTGCGRMSFWC